MNEQENPEENKSIKTEENNNILIDDKLINEKEKDDNSQENIQEIKKEEKNENEEEKKEKEEEDKKIEEENKKKEEENKEKEEENKEKEEENKKKEEENKKKEGEKEEPKKEKEEGKLNNIEKEDVKLDDEKTDEYIIRCEKCLLIPIITIDQNTYTIHCECENKHIQPDVSICKALNDSKKISFKKCSKCEEISEEDNYICIQCLKVFCLDGGCKKKHMKENPTHKLIEVKNIDSTCLEHLTSFSKYCKDCKKIYV